MPDNQSRGLVAFRKNGSEVECRLDSDGESVWASAADVAALFDTSVQNVSRHIKNIFNEGELNEIGTVKLFTKVQLEGGKSVQRAIQHYNLDVILSVGYRVNSKVATRFRRWATAILKDQLIQGYSFDEERLKSDPEALRALAGRIRRIRTEKKQLFAKVRDVFKVSAADCDADSQAAKTFFAMAQDKFHYAVTQRTAAQLVLDRADADKPHMGMVHHTKDIPTLDEARIGKNYLSEDELRALENICEQFLLFAESKAFRGQRMTMEELSFKLNTLLTANDYPVLRIHQGPSR